MLSLPGEVSLHETHTYQSTGEETLVIQMSAKQVFWFDLNNEEQEWVKNQQMSQLHVASLQKCVRFLMRISCSVCPVNLVNICVQLWSV